MHSSNHNKIKQNYIPEDRVNDLINQALSLSQIGYWEVDLTENKVYWSEMTRKIHEVPENYEPNLEEGINFYKEGEHRDRITELVENAVNNGTSWEVELIIVTYTKNERWVRAKGEVQMSDGIPVRLFGTFQDIDEQKRIHIKHRNEITKLLKIATNSTNIGIWEYDITNNGLDWDDNMFNLYGIEKNDFSHAFNAWESALHPADKLKSVQNLQQCIDTKSDFASEFRIITEKGEIKHIKAHGKLSFDEFDNPNKMIGINWDITDIKNTQLKLNQSQRSFQGAF